MTSLRSSAVTGALAGYAASRTMDAVTTWFRGRQSAASRAREEELASGGTLVQLGEQLGRATRRDLTRAQADRVGTAVHRSFGVGYGILAAVLARRGMRPLPAGLAAAAAGFLVVDEGTSLPQATAYPLVSHVRGVVGHGTHGLVTGLLLEAALRD